jgi:hypothetical protein
MRWEFPVIDIGTVKFVHTVATKKIVAIDLAAGVDQLLLDGTLVKFGTAEPRARLVGCNWWPDRREVDLLFDNLPVVPAIGSNTYIIKTG